MHLAQRFESLARRFGNRPALECDGEALSYEDFVGRLFAFGSGLWACGLQRGATVALLLPDTVDYLVADYGVMAAGLVRLPLDPRLSQDEMLSQLKLAEAAAIVTTAEHGECVSRLKAAIPDIKVIASGSPFDDATAFEMIVAAGRSETPTGGSASDLAALNFSGGTTGRPKATMISHAILSTVMTRVPVAFEIKKSSIFLNVRPLWPIAQVIVMSHLSVGAKVVLGGRFVAAQFCDLVALTSATRTSLVPTQIVRLLNHLVPDDPRLGALEAIYVGGSRLSTNVFERALELLGPKIGILYGLTEAPITTYLLPRELDVPMADRREVMASSGRIIDGYEVMLDSPSDNVTCGPKSGPAGEVVIRGDNVMSGYWKEPDLTAEALRDGWLHTNDLGTFDAGGRLYIVGRLNDIIRTGSSTVLPREVEDVIASQVGIADVAVTGLPDEEWGEIVVAFVSLEVGALLTEADIIANCGEALGKFKRPKRVFFVDEIPRSHYGKILKSLLLKKLEQPAAMRRAELQSVRTGQ